MSKRLYSLMSVLIVLSMLVGACGGGAAPAPEPVVEAPLAAPQVEAPAPAPTAVPVVEAAPAVDVVGVVSEYLAGIPDGYMNVGRLDAFKEALAAGPILIDVREVSEYAAGHIPGAVNVPLRTLAQNLDKIPTDQPVFVYCAKGHRTGIALSALRSLGYDNVRAFSPGWRGWSSANEEVSTESVVGESYPVPAFDQATLEAVDAFLSTLPEGWLSVDTVEALDEAMAAGAVVVDVREPNEYAEGAIPGALIIPLRTLGANLDQIPQDKPVILYCATGFRTALALGALQIMGYSNVRAFPPSYGAWEAAHDESTEAPVEVAAAIASDFNIVEAVDAYLAGIPEGYMNLGRIEAFKEVLENTNPLLIDVREPSEYAAGHIPGAINIPVRTLADNLDKIPGDQPVIIYCASGLRAGLALTALRVMGYDNVRSFSPSWRAWSAAGEEASTDAVEAQSYPLKAVDAEALAAVSEFLTNLPEGWLAIGTVEGLDQLIDVGAQLIDVREVSEFEGGHITDAINLPLRTIGQNLDQIATDKPVVVYCATGFRAALALSALQLMGYSNVRTFPPSYGAWEAAQ